MHWLLLLSARDISLCSEDFSKDRWKLKICNLAAPLQTARPASCFHAWHYKWKYQLIRERHLKMCHTSNTLRLFSEAHLNWRCFWFSYISSPKNKQTAKTSSLNLTTCSCFPRYRITIWLKPVDCSLLLNLQLKTDWHQLCLIKEIFTAPLGPSPLRKFPICTEIHSPWKSLGAVVVLSTWIWHGIAEKGYAGTLVMQIKCQEFTSLLFFLSFLHYSLTLQYNAHLTWMLSYNWKTLRNISKFYSRYA